MYDWQRFWCPREGRFSLSDNGFLADPMGEHGKLLNPEVESFDSIVHFPCLALLGEPSIGKTTALKSEQRSLETRIVETGEKLLHLDLGEYGEESRLIRDIFESEVFTDWLVGDHCLHLFLDSLDECRIQVPQVGKILINHFKQIQDELPRMQFRVACRTTDWPQVLEFELPRLWEGELFAAYELVPLRKQDVRLAAEVEGIDPDQFIHDINRAEVVPLAIKPLTLKMLLRIRQRHNEIPIGKVELYELGCKNLCQELNPNRRDLRHIGGTGALNVEQRMIVASRIAAVSVFCARPIITCDTILSEITSSEVSLSDLLLGTEYNRGEPFIVTEDAILETLGTGLFTSRGMGLEGFAHQTYAEFLAARYLIHRALDLKQILSLVCHVNDPGRHIVPQLRETAAWAASMNKDILETIAVKDPQVLLSADVSSLTADDRNNIVEVILKQFEAEEITDRDWSLSQGYRKLTHPALVEQLHSIIIDTVKPERLRGMAIDIAEACELRELQELLLEISHNPEEPQYVRNQAACALARIGDCPMRGRMRSLLTPAVDDDPWDELKGWALRALWPDIISAEELFTYITIPKHLNYHGSYMSFLMFDLPESLQPDYLPHALNWAVGFIKRTERHHRFERLINRIVVLAWQYLRNHEVLERMYMLWCIDHTNFVRIVTASRAQKEHEVPFSNAERRHIFTEYVVTHTDSAIGLEWDLFTQFPRLIESEDLIWILSRVRSSENEEHRKRWAKLANCTCSQDTKLEHMSLIMETARNIVEFREVFRWLVEPVNLGSDRARKMREEYERRQKMEAERFAREHPPLVKPPPTERIESALGRFEVGEVDMWTLVIQEMTLEERSVRYENNFTPDISQLPGWINSNQLTRDRILNAAKTFIVNASLTEQEKLFNSSVNQNQYSAFQAFYLIRKYDLDHLDSLDCNVWTKWLPLFFGPIGFRNTEEIQQELIWRVYEVAPCAVIEIALAYIDRDSAGETQYLHLNRIAKCWNERMCTSLLKKARITMEPSVFTELLQELLAHDCTGARDMAVELLQTTVPADIEGRPRAAIAAIELIWDTTPFDWQLVWTTFERDDSFANDLIKRMADRFDMDVDRIVLHLTADQMAALYIWLARRYPHHEDPDIEGTHGTFLRESIAHFRDALLRYLREAATPMAYTAVERIRRELPDLKWLSWTRVEARKNLLRNTWMPPTPVELLELVASRTTRLVQSDDQLLEVIIESMDRLEAKLQGETPAAPDLWDQVDRTSKHERFRPKDENHFSDYVKRHLEEDLIGCGIVALREVQIRPGEGSGKGERTDIHVTGVVLNPFTSVTKQVRVIIEVKGCWHRELQIAMETQLVERYLKDNDCTHGLYLVGWYMCQQWDTEHYAYLQVPSWSIDKAQDILGQQAKSLCSDMLEIRCKVINTALR